MSATTDARPTGPDFIGGSTSPSMSRRFFRSPVARSCLAMYGATAAGFGLGWIVSVTRHQTTWSSFF
jgi:hypothetical protein